MVWTLIEPGVAIVASSLVTIRPLLRQLRLKGFESSENSRGGGVWGFHVRSGGEHYGKSKKAGASRRSRAASGGLDVFGAKDEVKLHDLEAGCAMTTTVDNSRKRTDTAKGGHHYSSRETTLTSRDGDLGTSPVPNFTMPLRVNSGVGPRPAARNYAQDGSVLDSQDGDEVEDEEEEAESPVSPWMMRAEDGNGPAGLTFPPPQQRQQQQQPATLRGTVKHGKTMWQSETPNSAEEAEAIQGLRELSSRPGVGRSPFS